MANNINSPEQSVPQAPAPAPVQKKSNVLTFVLLGCGVLILCSILGVLGVVVFGIGAAKTAVDNITKQGDQIQKGNSDAPTKKLGETQDADGVKITISKPEIFTSTDEFSQPKEGNQNLAIYIEVVNGSKDRRSVSDLFITMTSLDGTSISKSLTASKEPAIGSGLLSAGESLKGYVTFEVPKSTKDLILQYKEVGLFGDYIRKWQIQNL